MHLELIHALPTPNNHGHPPQVGLHCQAPLMEGSYIPILFLQTRTISFPKSASQFSALFEPAHPRLDLEGLEHVSASNFTY